jgi:serine/threonine protein kinase
MAANDALPNGHYLQDYRIARKIGGGGFSLVYLAYDPQDQPVAIKEYLPLTLVRRGEDYSVQPNSEENRTTFRYGLKCFFEEGRSLARIVHPNVVRVVNFFRAHDTVYMVMRYERGKTLQEYLQGARGPVKESFIRRVFAQLLNGLREVHTLKLLHLDIKPSNIYIRLDGTPVLIDFGAARATLTHDANRLQPMYTPGFAAPEQYHQADLLGPWTDIYSVGASMYACLSGSPPQPADARLSNDKMTPAARGWHDQYSPALLELIDACLKLDYMARPQSVFTLQRSLMEVPDIAPAKTSMLSTITRMLRSGNTR